MAVRKTTETVADEPVEAPIETSGEPSSPVLDNLYCPRENGCPVCGDKLRTDNSGSLMCSVNANNCPRLK